MFSLSLLCPLAVRAEESGWQEIGASIWLTDHMYLEMSREAHYNSLALIDVPYYANLKAAFFYNAIYFVYTGLQFERESYTEYLNNALYPRQVPTYFVYGNVEDKNRLSVAFKVVPEILDHLVFANEILLSGEWKYVPDYWYYGETIYYYRSNFWAYYRAKLLYSFDLRHMTIQPYIGLDPHEKHFSQYQGIFVDDEYGIFMRFHLGLNINTADNLTFSVSYVREALANDFFNYSSCVDKDVLKVMVRYDYKAPKNEKGKTLVAIPIPEPAPSPFVEDEGEETEPADENGNQKVYQAE